MSCSKIHLRFSLVLFFFSFFGAEVRVVPVLWVIAMAGVAGKVGDARFIVGLSVAIVVVA